MSTLLPLALSLQLLSGSDGMLLQNGDPAPPFSMRDLDREVFALANYVGSSPTEAKKAIFISFFATWCKPCIKELPIVKDLNARWKSKGVEVVYIGQSQGAKELGPFAKENKFPWRVVPDSFGLLSRRYGASKLPHVVIVDKDGKIAFQHQGITPNLKEVLDGELARITGQPIPGGGKAAAPAAEVKRFSKTLSFGRVPSGGDASARWEPLGIFLREKVEAEIELKGASSYEDFEKKLAKGEFDIANAGPVLLQSVLKTYEPLVRVERQGTPTYLGIIFATRQSKLRKLKQLKGKTIGLVAEHSTSGGLYPLKALIDAGLKPGKDVKLKWLGSHSKVAEAVKSGEVDAGACYEDCRDAVWTNPRGKAVASRILAYTDEIPAEMIVVKRSLDGETKKRLREALNALNKVDGIMKQMSRDELPITGMLRATDKDLDAVGKVVQLVGRKRKR